MGVTIEKLHDRHRAAIRLRVLGKNNEYIAEELGIKKRTLVTWWSMPIFKAAIAEQMEKVDSEFALRLAENAMVGLDTLKEMAMEDHTGGLDAETRLEIVREMLDRNPWTRKPDQGRGGLNMNFNFETMSDEELRNKAREMLQNAAALEGEATEQPGLGPSANGGG